MKKNKKTTNNKPSMLHSFFLKASRIIVYPSFYLYNGVSSIAKSISKLFVRFHDDDEFSFDDELLKKETLDDLDADYSSFGEMIQSNSYSSANSEDNGFLADSELISDITSFGDNPDKFISQSVYDLYKTMQKYAQKNAKKKGTAKIVKSAKQLILELNNSTEMSDVTDKNKTWRYEAINQKGKKVRGYCEASSKLDVINVMSDSELFIFAVKVQGAAINLNLFTVKIKNKDLIFIITQLSTYLKAGIALSDAFGILIRQTKNKNYKHILYNVKYELLLGESLSNAMLHQKKAFPMVLINMIRSAELTGELPEVLDDMADYFTEIEETRKQMISALTYPSLVLIFTIAVMIFVMLYVVPKFVEIYSSMNANDIPAFTKWVISASKFIENNVLFILMVIIIILLIILYLYKYVKSCRKLMQLAAMKFPVIGKIIIYNEVTVFSKTLSSLLKHNVFITESMEVLNKITNNEIFREMIMKTMSNLMRGDKLSSAFKDQWAFPLPAYEMIVTGEQTGQLAEMMAMVSSYYQSLHRNMVSRIKSLIEPIVIIILTFGVGAILLAVVIPMFNMYQTVQNMEV